MDDYKRTLYMQVLTKLYDERAVMKANGYYNNMIFLCPNLRSVIYREANDTPIKFLSYEEILKEFFPEIQGIFDGKYYHESNWIGAAMPYEAWWSHLWIEPRIRALEFVLRD